jgi:hypothetical protein
MTRTADDEWRDRYRDDVMFAFSVEPQQDATTFARYLNAYPQFAADLIDLAHELNLSVSLGPSDAPLEDDANAQAAWLQYAAVRPTVVALIGKPAPAHKGET